MEILKFMEITKEYSLYGERLYALNNVSFTVRAGEFVALTGSSGAGKSTLLNMAGCLDYPDSGQILYKNYNILRFGERQAALYRNTVIGFVFQNFYLDPKLTAMENVMLPLVYGKNRVNKTLYAKKALETVGLENRMNHRPGELSGGQKQRVAIARAVVNSPEIILADEPTGNLDTSSAESVMKLLSEINRLGKTVIMVTHNPSQLQYCTREIAMRDGKIIKDTYLN